MGAVDKLKSRDADGQVLAVIEVASGSRQKYKFDPKLGVFLLHKALPLGLSFPYDFGFIPGTDAADGDPLDVIVFADQPLEVGSVVPCRLVGLIRAEQSERGESKTIRNDRLLAVAVASRRYRECDRLADLSTAALDELEKFFETYNAEDGKTFRVVSRGDEDEAEKTLRRHRRARR